MLRVSRDELGNDWYIFSRENFYQQSRVIYISFPAEKLSISLLSLTSVSKPLLVVTHIKDLEIEATPKDGLLWSLHISSALSAVPEEVVRELAK